MVSNIFLLHGPVAFAKSLGCDDPELLAKVSSLKTEEEVTALLSPKPAPKASKPKTASKTVKGEKSGGEE